MTVVVPTKDEAANASRLVTRLAGLRQRAPAVHLDVVVVDDSDDDTSAAIARARGEAGLDERFLRIVRREPGMRHGGLSGAVIHGMRYATGRWVVVMDGDLQHPPELVPDLVATGVREDADLVVATRYSRGGGAHSLSMARQVVSRVAALSARLVMGRHLATISDPMSGFFAVRRDRLHVGRLRPHGFKILIEIVGHHPDLRIAELPYDFAPRLAGHSKASYVQAVGFGYQLLELRFSHEDGRKGPHLYDLHGLYTISSERALPELAKFRVRALEGIPSLAVEVGGLVDAGPGETIDLTSDHAIVSYRERAGFAVDVESGDDQLIVRVSPFVAGSPHVLYTNVVEPILRWKLVELGHVLVHAACFADDDRAFLITARTDTGKTTTMLKVLERTPFDFLSDDLTLLAPDGHVLTYPKPLTISRHTVHALRRTDLTRSELAALKVQSRLHSREGRRFAFLLTKYRLPVASINAIVQRLVPPPKYHVERLVLGVRHCREARASGLLVIQRGGTADVPLDSAEALEILVENCDDAYGFPPYSTLERMLHAMSSDDLRSRERELIGAALGSLPCRLLRSDTLDWADHIPRLVDDWSNGNGNGIHAPSTNGVHAASTNGRHVPSTIGAKVVLDDAADLG